MDRHHRRRERHWSRDGGGGGGGGDVRQERRRHHHSPSWRRDSRNRSRFSGSPSPRRRYSSPRGARRRHHSRSPHAYHRRVRSRSISPYSPPHKRRRRSGSRDNYSHRRRSGRSFDNPYRRSHDRHRRRSEHRRSRDESSDRPRRRRRDQSLSRSSSYTSDSRGSSPPSPPDARHSARAGVVSDDEQEGIDYKPVASARKDPPRKKRGGGASASSGKDDTVGHFKGGNGTVIADRYRVVREVGVGTFGRVLECVDLKKRRSRSRGNKRTRRKRRESRVAIKIVRNVKRYYDSALIEADIVRDVNRRGGRGISHCAIMHDAFTFSGHFCLAFENLGPSLYDFLKKHSYQPFPMVCVRPFCKQLLETLEFLHSFRLIHTDLKPENILLTNYRERSYKWRGRIYQIPESTNIKIIDFGGATYDDEKKSSVVNTRQYRAPEVILSMGWSKPSDLWSAGCILAELYMGELLFATHDNIEHLALMERTIGPFSRRMLKRAKSSPIAQRAFDSSGRHLLGGVLGNESMSFVRKALPLESIIHEEDSSFLKLLRRMLVIDPDEREPASELVQYNV